MKNNKAFTLVELLAVVAIIAIIGAVATPNVIKMIDNSNKEQLYNDASLMISKAKYKFRTDSSNGSTGEIYMVEELLDNEEKGYEAGFVNASTTGYTVYLKKGNCQIGDASSPIPEQNLKDQGKSIINCN